MNIGRNAHERSRHAIAVSHPVQGVQKSPRIAAFPSARSPISRRLYLFKRCPRFLCLGRKTSALPPLFFQRPFHALICTQHAWSLRRLPLPFAHVLRHVEAAVRVRCAVQDSSATGIKKELPIGTTLGYKKPRTIGSSNSESTFCS